LENVTAQEFASVSKSVNEFPKDQSTVLAVVQVVRAVLAMVARATESVPLEMFEAFVASVAHDAASSDRSEQAMVRVLLAAAIVLFVRVSVVALPTIVSVASKSVAILLDPTTDGETIVTVL
jgi:hypothetical protein